MFILEKNSSFVLFPIGIHNLRAHTITPGNTFSGDVTERMIYGWFIGLSIDKPVENFRSITKWSVSQFSINSCNHCFCSSFYSKVSHKMHKMIDFIHAESSFCGVDTNREEIASLCISGKGSNSVKRIPSPIALSCFSLLATSSSQMSMPKRASLFSKDIFSSICHWEEFMS